MSHRENPQVVQPPGGRKGGCGARTHTCRVGTRANTSFPGLERVHTIVNAARKSARATIME
jgi:hypothetical protein